jgi:hypothetical protein
LMKLRTLSRMGATFSETPKSITYPFYDVMFGSLSDSRAQGLPPISAPLNVI